MRAGRARTASRAPSPPRCSSVRAVPLIAPSGESTVVRVIQYYIQLDQIFGRFQFILALILLYVKV